MKRIGPGQAEVIKHTSNLCLEIGKGGEFIIVVSQSQKEREGERVKVKVTVPIPVEDLFLSCSQKQQSMHAI